MVNEYFFSGTLPENSSTYVKRQADDELFNALKDGHFSYVFNSRQTGKSSLRVQVMRRLQQERFACCTIDVSTIGTRQVTAEKWFAGILRRLEKDFELDLNLGDWLREREWLSPLDRFREFIESVLFKQIPQYIIIFIDEIDSVLSLDFPTDDFFAFIRACHNLRVDNIEYKRLTFCLLGTVTPFDLIQDKTRTPFNIGKSIELTGFTLDEAKASLTQGLTDKVDNPVKVLEEILYWTGGQPFLTQKLCSLIIKNSESKKPDVQNIVDKYILHNWESQDEPQHLKTISQRILNNEQRVGRRLGIYQQILQHGELEADETLEQVELRLSGLVVKKNAKLRIYNRIYGAIFNKDWVESELLHIRPYGEAIAAWLHSSCQDKSQLLRGEALQDAKAWAKGKRLSNDDHNFLLASEELEKLEAQAAFNDAIKTNNILSKNIIKVSIYLFFVFLFAAFALTQLFFSTRTSQEKEQAALIDKELESQVNNDTERLLSAIQAGQRLQTIVKDNRPLQQYPTTKPIVALQSILSELDRGNHPHSINDVAFSPDGKSIVTAHSDGTAKIWNLSGKHLATLKGHESSIWEASFSSDGQRIATVGLDWTMRIWDLSGRQISKIRWERYSIFLQNLILTPDWKNLIVIDDSIVSLYNLNGQMLAQWQPDHLIYDFSLSPDGKNLATIGEDDNTIRIWDLSGKKLNEWKVKGHAVSRILFSSKREGLYSIRNRNTIQLWDINGKLLSKAPVKIANFERFSFSPDEKTIAIAGKSDIIKFSSLTGKLLSQIQGKPGELKEFDLSPDGKRLVTGGYSGGVSIWNLSGKRIVEIIKGKYKKYENIKWKLPKTEYNSFVFSSTGKYLATVEPENKILTLWNYLRQITQLKINQGEIQQILFSPNEKYIATVVKPIKPINLNVEDTSSTKLTGQKLNNVVYIWDISGKLLAKLKVNQDKVLNIAFSQDSQLLAIKREDSKVQV